MTDRKFGTKQRNPVKFGSARNVWYLLLQYLFLTGVTKFWFLEQRLVSRLSPPKFEIFLIFCNFRRYSLQSFGNSWGNSYTRFVILDIRVRFTYGKLDLYQNIVKFQNISTKTVWKFSFFSLDFQWFKFLEKEIIWLKNVSSIKKQ